MILINRKLLIILSVLIISASIGAGFFGYSRILGLEGHSQDDIRFQAENFLFYFIVTTVVLITGFAVLLLRARHVDRKLDRLIDMSRYSDLYPSKHFGGLGPLGERLKLLYSNINKLNIRKTMKISALANLTEFLMNNISLPMIVTDAAGSILYSSSVFNDKYHYSKGDIKSSKIDTIFPEINVPALMLELYRQHIPVEQENNRTKITCYPVHNVSADMNYVVFVPDKKAAYSNSLPDQPSTKKIKAFSSGLGKLLSIKKN
ncbi:MAG: hypothetical protein L3J12_03375 [Spirochaetales bacterium]|nr:hypothetical protein [Spirochaetales bacterium]